MSLHQTHRPTVPAGRGRGALGVAVGILAFVGATTSSAPAAEAPGPRVIATVAAVRPAVLGGDAEFRITARNVGERPTSQPVAVRLSTAGYSSSSPEWACDGTTCTYESPLAVGASTAALRVHRAVSPTLDFGYSSAGVLELRAAPIDDRGVAGQETGAIAPTVFGPSSELATAVSGVGTADRYGPRRFHVVVRNLGDRRTPDVARVRFASSDGSGPVRSASGDGWTCDPGAATCRTDGSVPAGGEPAPIAVVLDPPATLRDGTASLTATVAGGDPTDRRFNDDASGSVPLVATGQVALVAGVEDAGLPADAEGRGRFAVRVSNLGAAPSAGTVDVVLGRQAGVPDPGLVAQGPGWSCPAGTGRCSTTAVAPAGGALPALTVATGNDPDQPSRQTLTAVVRGGGDAEERDGQGAATRPADAQGGVGTIVTSIRRLRPSIGGGTATLDVVARNTSTTGRTAPTSVTIGVANEIVRASGPGWTCTAGGRCSTSTPVPAGSELPPLTVARTASVRDAIPYSSDRDVRVTASPVGNPDPSTGGSSIDVPVARDGADVVATVGGARPTSGGETETYRTVVRNAGNRATTGRIDVSVDYAFDGTRLAGEGWVCRQDQCSHSGPVDPGQELPPIVATRPVAITGDRYERSGAARVSTSLSADDADVTNDVTSADGETAGAMPDVTATIEDVEPEVGDHPAGARVVVRNTSSVAASGPVAVRSDARMRGDGWTCGAVCVHPGPVPAGGSLPALDAVVPLPSPTAGGGVPSTRVLRVTTSDPSDGRSGNDTVWTEIPAAGDTPGRPLGLALDRPSSPAPGAPFLVSARLFGRTAIPGSSPIRVRAVPAPGMTIERISVDGADVTCDSPSGCDISRSLGYRDERRIVATVRLADGVQDGTVRLSATASDDGTEPAVVVAPVRRTVERPDVALQLDDAQPARAGAHGGLVTATVRNGGSATNDPVSLELKTRGAVTSAVGPGWACDAPGETTLTCRFDGPVGAARTLPPVVVRTNAVEGVTVEGVVSTPDDRTNQNDLASATVPYLDALGSGLLTAVVPVDRDGSIPGGFDVLVRNADDDATTRPLAVDLTPFGYWGELITSGDGWTCSQQRCTRSGALQGGASAPPIRVRMPAGSERETGTNLLTSLTARTDAPGASGGERPEDRSDREEIALSADGHPASADRPAGFDVRVANLASRPTRGPVEVGASPSFKTPGQVGRGDGWVCPPLADGTTPTCRFDRPLAAGEQAPLLTFEGPDPADGTSPSITVGGAVVADVPARSSRISGGTATSAAARPVTSTALAVDLEVPSPARIADGAVVIARVTNPGLLPNNDDVVVSLASFSPAGAIAPSGDGWSCTRDQPAVCRRPGPVAPGASLPPISIPISTDRDLTASVVTPTSGPFGSGTVSSHVGVAGRPARLITTVRIGGPVRPGETFSALAVVKNDGSATVTGTTTLSLSEQPPGTVAAGAGWVCDQGITCTRSDALPAGQSFPTVALTGTTPATGGVAVRGAARFPGTAPEFLSPSGSRSTASPAPRRADLVLGTVVERPASPGLDWLTRVVVSNAGDRRATGQVTVDLRGDAGAALPAGSRAQGDGWTCDGGRCRTDQDVPVGGEVPPLRVAVPVPVSPTDGAVVLSTVVTSTDDQGSGGNGSTIRGGIAAATAAPDAALSPFVSIGTADDRARPGERVAVQIPIQGLAPGDDRPADLQVDLPGALRYDGPVGDAPAPTVKDGTLRWALRTPVDGDRRLVSFWAVVSPDASSGVKALSAALTIDGRPTVERTSGELTVGLPRLDTVDVTRVRGDDAARIGLRGEFLRAADRFELVRGDEHVVGDQRDGGDRSVSVSFDVRGANAGTYDVVVRTTEGVVLRLRDAITVLPRAPSTPAPAGGGTSQPTPKPPTASGGGTGAGPAATGLASLVAGLAGRPAGSGSGATTSPKPASHGSVRPVGRLRPPRIATLVRSGWVVRVRTTKARILRVELIADTATARRLRVRSGTVLARASSQSVRAGEISLRLRVPASVRTRVRRAARLSGTLRLAVTGGDGDARSTRSLSIRR